MKKKRLLLGIGLLVMLNSNITNAETQAEWDYRHKAYYGSYSKAMFHAYYGPNAVPPESQWDVCSPEARKDIIEAKKKKQGYQTSKTKANTPNPKAVPQTSAATQAKAKIEAAAKAKAQAAENAAVPNSIKISQTIKNTDTRIQVLTNKQAAGVDASAELELLKYKSQKLWELPDLKEEHRVAYSNLINGVITQDEYDTITAKLRRKDIEIATSYDQIMNITTDSLAKALEEEKALKVAADRKAKKKEIARRLLNQGTLYTPPAASNWIRQGADVLELFK